MYVIVAGAGALGREVASALLRRRHDVVLIDLDKATCDAVYAELGALTVHGSATSIHSLEDAGAQKAELLVTAMASDADNIACALLARSLGVQRVIGRLRDPSYQTAYEVAGVTHLVRATQLLCNQIVLHVEHPQVEEIVGMEDEAAQIFSLRLPVGARCGGRSVAEIAADRKFPRDCLFVGVRRGGQGPLHIPRGDTCLQDEDMVMVIATGRGIDRAVALLTRTN